MSDIHVLDRPGENAPPVVASAVRYFETLLMEDPYAPEHIHEIDGIEFACYSKACAPPPTGVGGSRPGGSSSGDSGGGARSSGGGGGTGGDEEKISANPEEKKAGKALYAKAKAEEPAISALMKKLVGDQNPADESTPPPAQLYGWKYRLKKEAAISDKIARIKAEVKEESGLLLTTAEAASQVKDAIRYTVHFADDSFGKQAQSIVDHLRANVGDKTLPQSGVRVKNTWPPDPERGNPYKGINVQVTRPDGIRFEIQFHTPKSQAVKDLMHKMYEESRLLPSGSSRRRQLEGEMRDLADTLSAPTGAIHVLRLLGEETFVVLDSEKEPVVYYRKEYAPGKVAYARRSGFTTSTLKDGKWVESGVFLKVSEDPEWEIIDADDLP